MIKRYAFASVEKKATHFFNLLAQGRARATGPELRRDHIDGLDGSVRVGVWFVGPRQKYVPYAACGCRPTEQLNRETSLCQVKEETYFD